ncbi:MAG: hypothetical protein KDD22_06090, partial [Bdellovibrionales bacterium]|nr:hypothetical protein [Bdellovibrionales bacterium]
MFWKSSTFLLLFISTLPLKSWAAACCGGGGSLPALLIGDDKAQVTAAFSDQQMTVDHVDSNGLWSKSNTHQQVRTWSFSGATLLSDRWQMGLSIPVMERNYLNYSETGLSDVTLGLGY